MPGAAEAALTSSDSCPDGALERTVRLFYAKMPPMDKEKVQKLAQLARIKISDIEAENLSREFASILGYVKDIGSVSKDTRSVSPESFPVRNIMRDDEPSHEAGFYADRLLSAAPHQEGGYIKVKKILQ